MQLEAAGSELKITPHSGTIGPEGSILVRVQLIPTEQRIISVSIPCNIHQKFRNLRLDVKGEGYYLVPSLKLIDKGKLQMNR